MPYLADFPSPPVAREAFAGGFSEGGKALLTLDELTAYDTGTGRGIERLFKCPFCGADERAFHVNTETGHFNCKRGSCKTRGLLREFWADTPKPTVRAKSQARLRKAFELPPSAPQVEVQASREIAFDSQPLTGTRGAAYLCGRGVSLEIAQLAGVCFAPDWFGRAAITFTLHNKNSVPVAAQGRYIDGRTDPKTRTMGPKKEALFLAPGLDGFGPLDAKERFAPLIITEAPLDALSLSEAGFPAVALCGTTGPQWLRIKAAFRSCFLAFDADDAGDRAADELAPTLESFGATVHRLRPSDGAKDWNEFLMLFGCDALTVFLAGEILTK